MHIGTRLREIRKRRGLNQRELSVASEVSLSLIRQLEQGTVAGTRMETAHKLAAALRVNTSSLLERDDEDAPAETAESWRPLQLAVQVAPATLAEEPTMHRTGCAPLASSRRGAGCWSGRASCASPGSWRPSGPMTLSPACRGRRLRNWPPGGGCSCRLQRRAFGITGAGRRRT
ncbi:helix-turn-helix domain-containing protein [Streptomyces sp. NPDC015125]|uniref:helix-turn-helix domain-containing protein n=1 Tax=Streptomyces sp. NPDC015125 TaxID=3364938 RepID=UPI0036FE3848